MDGIWQLGQRLRMLVTRGTVSKAILGKRTLIEAAGLASETGQKIELILPFGYSARPDGGDVLLFQVTGSRGHLVATGADKADLHIPDLKAGEFGLRDGRGQQVVFRTDRIEITTPKKLAITVTGDVEMSAGGAVTVTASGNAVVKAEKIMLGGAGGKAVVVDGDPVKGGRVKATVTDVTAK